MNIDPNSRPVQLGALLDKLASELALGRLGEMTEVVVFLRGPASALICVDGTEDSGARAQRLLEQALEWQRTGVLPA